MYYPTSIHWSSTKSTNTLVGPNDDCLLLAEINHWLLQRKPGMEWCHRAGGTITSAICEERLSVDCGSSRTEELPKGRYPRTNDRGACLSGEVKVQKNTICIHSQIRKWIQLMLEYTRCRNNYGHLLVWRNQII